MMILLKKVMLEGGVHSLVFGSERDVNKKRGKSERSKVPGQGLTEGCASEDALQAVAGLAGSERMTTANQSMKTDIQTHTGHTRL